jgi:NADH dehydrogenase [ubiquinone] 1 alpha subcomplex assembly factor 7
VSADDFGRVDGRGFITTAEADVNPLLRVIQSLIKVHGPMDVGTYMNLCLGHPDYGYYMTHDPFGVQGDFTTAPEISQLFGEMIGFWVMDIWVKLGRPEKIHVLEMGPGRGTMMADMLRVLKNNPDLDKALHVHLLDSSPLMQRLQEEKIIHLNRAWHSDLVTLPDDAPIIVVANEFFDALSVRQFIKTAHGYDEMVVGLNDQDQLLMGRKFTTLTAAHDDRLEGDMIEQSPARRAMMAVLCERIKSQQGAALIIDYGYTTPDGQPTLQAVRHHQPVSILDDPGRADITALVDFSDLMKTARDSGLEVYGPVGQGMFLQKLGIDHRLATVKQTALAHQIEQLESGWHRLIAPDQMGNLFKVMAVASTDIKPDGF